MMRVVYDYVDRQDSGLLLTGEHCMRSFGGFQSLL